MILFIIKNEHSHLQTIPNDLSLNHKTDFMFGKLNSEEIDQLLNNQLVGRIGCHSDGVTYVVPISYAFDGNNIYAHSFKGLKLTIMRKNPKVCFEVDDTQDLANWKSVICWGEFEELTDEVQKKRSSTKAQRSRFTNLKQ